MKFALANQSADRKPLPHDAVFLVIEVEAPYTEALLILDAARQAEQDIRAEQKAEERDQLFRALRIEY